METRNSALVVGLYLVGILVLGGAGVVYYQMLRDGTPGSGIAQGPASAIGPSRRVVTVPDTAALAKANQSIHALELTLDVSRKELQQHQATLKQKIAENRALREQLDRSLEMILGLLAEDAPADSPTDAAARSTLQTEVQQIQGALESAEQVKVASEDRIQQLEDQLMQRETEFKSILDREQREFALLLAEKQSVEEVAGSVIARLGAMAVPLLERCLHDERVEIRRWAARTLGVLGPEAREATLALRELQSDPDAEVRREADAALAKMD